MSGAEFREECSFVCLLTAPGLGHAGECALIHLDRHVEATKLHVKTGGFGDGIEKPEVGALKSGFSLVESQRVLGEGEFVFVGLSGIAGGFTVFFPIFGCCGGVGNYDEEQDGSGEKESRNQRKARNWIHCEEGKLRE